MNVITLEKPAERDRYARRQTAINLAGPLQARGVKIISTDCEAIEKRRTGEAFEKLLEALIYRNLRSSGD